MPARSFQISREEADVLKSTGRMLLASRILLAGNQIGELVGLDVWENHQLTDCLVGMIKSLPASLRGDISIELI